MVIFEKSVLRHFLFPAICLVVFGCKPSGKQADNKPLFSLLPSAETGIDFTNSVEDSEDFNIFTYRNFYNGGGVAIGDINNDGLSDIYFTANTKENKLYLNKGNWEFEDITASAGVGGRKGWSTGVAMADVNGDGWLDIYVCNSGDVKGSNKENELFINNGNLTFTEQASSFGLADAGYSTHASFFDYDLDGDLDCYLLNNSFKTIDRVEQFYIERHVRDKEGGDKLLRNDDGYFNDVSVEAGIYGSEIGFGLGVSVSDLNDDMLPDIYVSNDFWERDYLYINRGDGTFSEEIISRTGIISASSMGSDIADLDNDGDMEIFTTEMLPADNFRLKTMARFEETNIKELKVRSSYHYQQMQNCLQWNYGNGHFQEGASLSNLDATDWSWGCLLFDMDNDGMKDIFVANGIYRDITSMDFTDFVADRENIKKIVLEKGKFDLHDLLDLIPSTKIANYAFINKGGRVFKSVADSLGLGQASFSNGSAYGDLDNDGDLDLVVNNLNMPSFVYRNNSVNNYLKIKFEGAEMNKFAVGAKVSIYFQGNAQLQQNFLSRGFESSVDSHLLFGLGKLTQLDSMVVVWPDKRMQVMRNVNCNQVITLKYKEANDEYRVGQKEISPLFIETTSSIMKGDYKHRENEFNDFDYERLLPRKLSTEGPGIIVGDCNSDGLEDFVLLGAKGSTDKLFIQTKTGSFVERDVKAFQQDSLFESTCGVFFDQDGDGDLDLLVGSGGNDPTTPIHFYRLRYYQNQGQGVFEARESELTTINGNFSCILAEDFDKDGDPDLFLGRRVVPGNYGVNPGSFLLRNESNKSWTTITSTSIANAGMVTSAKWIDLDGDSLKDLVVIAEWKPIIIHKNTGTTLAEGKAIPGSDGWWTSINSGDFNGDGRTDLVLGNWGLNSRFKASQQRPLEMFVNDFDQNGKSDFVITFYPLLDSNSYPFATKMDLTTQLPMLKKRALTYGQYAEQGYEELFTHEQRKAAVHHQALTLQSSIVWNISDDNMKLEPLPIEVQVSPVFAIETADFNEDGNLDLLLCGNFTGLKHEIARQDGNRAIVLKGRHGGKFEVLSPQESGLFVSGEVRDVKLLRNSNGLVLLIGRNNDTMLTFQKVSK